MSRVLGLGDNTIDTYTDACMQYPGGNAVNVAVMCRRLGAQAGYLGCVGEDAGGALLLEALRAEGVDVARVRMRQGANARAYIGHVDGDRIFLGSQPGVRGQYRLEPADETYIGGFDLVHSSIYSDLGDALARVRRYARRLSFDFSNRWSDATLEQIAPDLEVAFLSCAEHSDARCMDLLMDCLRHGARVAVATRGSRGAMASVDGAMLTQPALPATVVDTLGAGDGFIAGFLLAHLDGQPLARSLRAGAQSAAQVCGWTGGFGHGIPWHGQGPGSPGTTGPA